MIYHSSSSRNVFFPSTHPQKSKTKRRRTGTSTRADDRRAAKGRRPGTNRTRPRRDERARRLGAVVFESCPRRHDGHLSETKTTRSIRSRTNNAVNDASDRRETGARRASLRGAYRGGMRAYLAWLVGRRVLKVDALAGCGKPFVRRDLRVARCVVNPHPLVSRKKGQPVGPTCGAMQDSGNVLRRRAKVQTNLFVCP